MKVHDFMAKDEMVKGIYFKSQKLGFSYEYALACIETFALKIIYDKVVIDEDYKVNPTVSSMLLDQYAIKCANAIKEKAIAEQLKELTQDEFNKLSKVEREALAGISDLDTVKVYHYEGMREAMAYVDTVILTRYTAQEFINLIAKEFDYEILYFIEDLNGTN